MTWICMDRMTSFKRHESSSDRAETSNDKVAIRVGKSDIRLEITAKASEQRIGKNVEELSIINQCDLQHYSRHLQNTHSSQAHMELSLR